MVPCIVTAALYKLKINLFTRKPGKRIDQSKRAIYNNAISKKKKNDRVASRLAMKKRKVSNENLVPFPDHHHHHDLQNIFSIVRVFAETSRLKPSIRLAKEKSGGKRKGGD